MLEGCPLRHRLCLVLGRRPCIGRGRDCELRAQAAYICWAQDRPWSGSKPWLTHGWPHCVNFPLLHVDYQRMRHRQRALSPDLEPSASDGRFPSASLPVFKGVERPEPESKARRNAIRAFAVATLVVTATYLSWRLHSTVDLAVWWVSIPLIAAEIHNAGGLLLFTVALWDVDVGPPWHRVEDSDLRVAVLIATYNEPEEVLLPTIAASVTLAPTHETWVLDDGRRENIRELATSLGARYLTRPDNVGAKAGNLNHALGKIDADVVAVLDADHVPLPNFLTNTLGYFEDPDVALVQTPQDFYNRDSFEHSDHGESRFNEEAVFYRVIAPGKNRWGGAFWCGTSALVRVEALQSVGGVATATVTEDIHTSIRMNRLGWKGVMHNEVLALGLAPADAEQYMLQRHRWALGAMQVLRKENPLFGKGLTFGQRLSFTSTLWGWFDSWRTLAFMLIAPVVLFTGASPISAPGWVYGPLFLTVFLAQFVALRLLARGRYPPALSLLFEVLRLPAVLPATLALFTGGSGVFQVTPKGRGDRSLRTPVPRILVFLVLLNVSALGLFVLQMAGVHIIAYESMAAAAGAAGFAVLNLGLVVWAVIRIRAWRFAGERRGAVRFPVDLEAYVQGSPCDVRDLSTTGAEVWSAGPVDAKAGERLNLVVVLGGDSTELSCNVRWRDEGEVGRVRLGLEFDSKQTGQVATIARALFQQAGAPDRARLAEAA